MSEKQETIADIIAEMRGQAGDDGYPLDIKHYADRLEAAHKRERGDCAKLREALDESRRIATDLGGCRLNDYWKLNEIVRVCTAALSAQPRNCDRYANHNDAMRAFDAFVREQGKLGFINPYTEAFKWLFATATEKEEGKDANE